MTTESIAIVGAGLAGAQAAQALRSRGFDGRVSLIGSESHPPYDRPPLSKGVLAGTTAPETTRLVPDAYWADEDIDLVLGQRVVSLWPGERRIVLGDGRTVDADKVLLCTGGRPRTLNLAGAELPGVFYLRTLDDANELRPRLLPGARVVVVGAGFIGAEVAASARGLGCDVTMIEIAQVPLWRVLGEQMGRVYAQVHRDHGVRLLTGVALDDILGDTDVRQVMLSDGRILDADVVVIGVGLVTSTQLAAQIGAEVGNGIIVDEYCETTVPGVFAAGDVANHPNAIIGERVRLEHWQNAQNQAQAAVSSMLGDGRPYCEVPWFWSDQYDLNLQVAGHPHANDRIAWRGDVAANSFSAFYVRDNLVRAVVAVNRPREVRSGMDLIAYAAPVDVDHLTDESVDLRKLAKVARDAARTTASVAGSTR